MKRSAGAVRLSSLERQSELHSTRFPILESLEENFMTIEDSRSQRFAEKVLELLEERFPWLGQEDEEQVHGADTVDELTDLHRCLIEQRSAKQNKTQETDQ
jgi:hypothetical protein